MKLIPASSARWMMRIASSWSVLPIAPKIIAPRQSGLTDTPVRPRLRRCMHANLSRADAGRPRESPSPLPAGRAGQVAVAGAHEDRLLAMEVADGDGALAHRGAGAGAGVGRDP